MADTAVRQQRGERPDTPREAYRLLPPRITFGVAAALFLLGAAGWVYTVREAGRMSGMVMGFGEIGGGMSMAMGVLSFVAMWAGMMVAMMAPTLVPVALAHRDAVRDRGIGSIPTAAFVGGFLLVWAATGLLALVPYRLILEIPATSGGSRWLAMLGGAVLVGVGAFQFAPWKVHCLRMCRMPMGAISGMDPLGSFATSFRAGLAHGWHCLGCCWSLMAALLVVGVMNLFWMAVIAAIFFIDKHWAKGEGFSHAVGIFFVALGLVVIAFPDVLPYISGVEMNGGASGDMGGGM